MEHDRDWMREIISESPRRLFFPERSFIFERSQDICQKYNINKETSNYYTAIQRLIIKEIRLGYLPY